MDQVEKAKRFSELHVKGTPLMLYNAWDAGSAKSILEAGALAIATSSWAVAEAQGYRDGEVIPVEFVERVVARIVATIDVPVTVDFEGGYSDVDDDLAGNVVRLLDLGVIGINPINNECLVSRDHVSVANVGPHRLDLRKKVLFESATSCLTSSGRLLIFLHGHVVGVVAIESFQRFSTDNLCNQVLNCRLGGLRTHPNLLLLSTA